MSAPVDVLATLDWAAEQVRAGAVRASDAEQRRVDAGIREARAAVAELIEAANAAIARSKGLHPAEHTGTGKGLSVEGALVRDRLEAALARMGREA